MTSKSSRDHWKDKKKCRPKVAKQGGILGSDKGEGSERLSKNRKIVPERIGGTVDESPM